MKKDLMQKRLTGCTKSGIRETINKQMGEIGSTMIIQQDKQNSGQTVTKPESLSNDDKMQQDIKQVVNAPNVAEQITYYI